MMSCSFVNSDTSPEEGYAASICCGGFRISMHRNRIGPFEESSRSLVLSLFSFAHPLFEVRITSTILPSSLPPFLPLCSLWQFIAPPTQWQQSFAETQVDGMSGGSTKLFLVITHYTCVELKSSCSGIDLIFINKCQAAFMLLWWSLKS